MRVYIAIKDAVPGQPESLYELGFMIQGRKTIFFVASAYICYCLGGCIIYFMTFGDTMGQLVASVTGGSLGSEFYCSRYFWVLILAVFLLTVVMKEELAELEWLAIVLFACCGLFIFCDVF